MVPATQNDRKDQSSQARLHIYGERIEHRCPRCGLLMAVERDGRLDVRIKNECHFIVLGGTMIATCRRCKEMWEITPKSRDGPDQAKPTG